MRNPKRYLRFLNVAFIERLLSLVLAGFLMSSCAAPAPPNDDAGRPPEILITTLDEDACMYATFQSHNQKVVANKQGIFVTYLHRSQGNDDSIWRLARSVDSGKTFQTVYEAHNQTKAPVIETDREGTLYLAHPDYRENCVWFYRFVPGGDYAKPAVRKLNVGACGKYSMLLDEKRGRLYYFGHSGEFAVLRLDGEIEKKSELAMSGPSAQMMYPYLCLDEDGTLYAAWTTQKHGVYLYWSIHFICSSDGGQTWRTSTGNALPLPVLVDETGPAQRITLDNEFDVHSWLWNLAVKDGKAHFAYLAQFKPGVQHYVRCDLASGTRERDIAPEWKGDQISLTNLDGFFATVYANPRYPLFAVSKTTDNRLGVLVSADNGATWRDYARSDRVKDRNLYSIGGAREITDDGWLIGSYTETGANAAIVKFFKVRTPVPTGPK